ncbi:unnamed protein product [Clavelina lepadiformis]|uniref:Uncharacterized protein n=1 Tax=Clavelina lepadiformis TaxID=159417 RepID=A0ABP0FJY9_CLALP
MASKHKFNALAAVRMMNQSDEEESDEGKDGDDEKIAEFLKVEVNETSQPLKSILKKKNPDDLLSQDSEEVLVSSTETGNESTEKEGKREPGHNLSEVKKDKSPSASKPNVPAVQKKIVLKITGLPYDIKVNELITFLGIWPRNGADGLKFICDTAGDPTGYGYIEIENHQDKMACLKMSGLRIKSRPVQVTLSSGNAMALEWMSTQRILKQIEQSPFVRIGNLAYVTSRQDIVRLLSAFDRKLEDVYCHTYKRGMNNSGFAYAIMDSTEMAQELCTQNLILNKRKLPMKRVHPELVFRWCRRNAIKLKIRDSVKYSMEVDVPVPVLEPQEDDGELPFSGPQETIINTMIDATKEGNRTNNVEDMKVKAINSDPKSNIFVYDEDKLDSVEGSNLLPHKKKDEKLTEEAEKINLDPDSNVFFYNSDDSGDVAVPFSPSQSESKATKVFRDDPASNIFIYDVDDAIDDNNNQTNRASKETEKKRSSDFDRKKRKKQKRNCEKESGSGRHRDFRHPPGSHMNTGPSDPRLMPLDIGPMGPHGPDARLLCPDGPMLRGPDPRMMGMGPNPAMVGPQMMLTDQIPLSPQMMGPNGPSGIPVLGVPSQMMGLGGPRIMGATGPDPRILGPMGPNIGSRGPNQRRPGMGPTGTENQGMPAQMSHGPRMGNMGASPVMMSGPNFSSSAMGSGMMPTIYVRMYNVPDQANTDDIKDFFNPVQPAKIAQNVGYDIYDVDFYNPQDALMALQRQGMMIRKNSVKLEMLPGPPVPLPPRAAKVRSKKVRKDLPLAVQVGQPQPMKRRIYEDDSRKGPLRRKEAKSLHNRVRATEPPKAIINIEVEPFPDNPLDYHIRPYDPSTPEGQCMIRPMEGFFCTLCRKFYKAKAAGYVTHCKTKIHYDNVKKYLEELNEKKENEKGTKYSESALRRGSWL